MWLELFTLAQMYLKSSRQQSHWASFIVSTVHTAKNEHLNYLLMVTQAAR